MSDEKVLVFGDRVREAVGRVDGWFNSLTGLGTDRDKTQSTDFTPGPVLTDEQAEGLYVEDDMASRACDALPEEAFKKGYEFKVQSMEREGASDTVVKDLDGHKTDTEIEVAEAGEIASAVKDYADAMGFQEKFVDAVIWGRVFGGGAIFLGINDDQEDLSMPLNEKTIKSFTHMNVIDKRYMSPQKWYTDPTSPNFGKPETYLITGDGVNSTTVSAFKDGIPEVHETRLSLFGGTRTPLRKKQDNNGFDISILQKMNEVLADWGTSWSALANLITDANQGVYSMEGLIDAIANEDTETIVKRMQLIDMSRSVARAVVLDADGESFERQNFTWSGIKEPFQLLMLRLSAVAGMPATILMAQSPAGMDATGESDLKWWEATVKAAQTFKYIPEMDRIFKLIMLAKEGPTGGKLPEKWGVEFPPIREMTEKEESEIRKNQSDTDKNYIETAVLLPEEVAMSRFGPRGYSTDTVIDLSARVALLEGEEMEEGPDTDPVDPVDPADPVDPVDPVDPADPVAVATAEGADVAKTALNGAQVSSMVDVSTKVANGELSEGSGVAILMAAFPTLTMEEAVEIAGQKKEKPEPPAQTPPPFAPAEPEGGKE
jgi:phage-related protein (TIGR01555 family)